MQYRHAGAGAGARRAAVGAAGRDDAGVARDLAGPFEGTGELPDGDAVDPGVLGMDDLKLGARGEADLLAHDGEVARLVGGDREAERLGVGDGVEHAAIGDVDHHGADTVDLQPGVEAIDESRAIGEIYRDAFALAARRT